MIWLDKNRYTRTHCVELAFDFSFSAIWTMQLAEWSAPSAPVWSYFLRIVSVALWLVGAWYGFGRIGQHAKGAE